MKLNITLTLIVLLLAANFTSAHDTKFQYKIANRQWVLKNNTTVEGSLLMLKEGIVSIESGHGEIIKYPLSSFSENDRAYVIKRYAGIEKLNVLPNLIAFPAKTNPFLNYKFWIFSAIWFFVTGYILTILKTGKKVLFPIAAAGFILLIYSFKPAKTIPAITGTNPLSIDSSFTPFKPNVYTHWDPTYFYVESKGIPSHQMMAGITNWQQQVPIPQCYTGSNAWSIPLNPVIAASPVPVNASHFTRGAIALAVNGIPIFNPYTNTGVDAYLDGQLDNWGGHCGKADDYHYHIAPLHLYSATSNTLAIAYAFDGFAVYGSLEPDGSPMQSLDANHGHYGTNGVYHYHGTAAAPYMIGNMVGQVTEDATFQIIPQAAASAVRPGQNPLTGAVITNCQPNASNTGYDLFYTLSGQTYTVAYNWTSGGLYTYNFISPPAATTTQTYNGFSPCALPTAVNNLSINQNNVSIYPNPARDEITISLGKSITKNDIKNISISDLNGSVVLENYQYQPTIDLRKVAKGAYLLRIKGVDFEIVKKLIVE
jgi:hypothetical protein